MKRFLDIILIIGILFSISGCTIVNSIYVTNYSNDTTEITLYVSDISSGFESNNLKNDNAIYKPRFNSHKKFDNRISVTSDSTKIIFQIPPKATVYLGRQYEIPNGIKYFTYTKGDLTQRFEFDNFTPRQVGLFKAVSDYKISDYKIKIGPGSDLPPPTYYLNGIKLGINKDSILQDLNPKRIKSIEVIKDSTKYGRLADPGNRGVIMIKTKDASKAMIYIHSQTIDWKYTHPNTIYLLDNKILSSDIEKIKGLGKLNKRDIDSIEYISPTDSIEKYGDIARDGIIKILTKKPSS